MNEEIVTCKNCGTSNLSSQNTCSNCGEALVKEIKEKRKKININISKILKIFVSILSVIIFIVGCFNIVKIIRDGILVLGLDSSKIKLLCILECIAPIFYLITGILTFIKRNSTKKLDNFVPMIICLISSICFIVPLLTIPDVFYLITGLTSYSPLNISAIISLEITLFYLFCLILDFKIFNKMALKILTIILFIVIMIILAVVLYNNLLPSEFLFPDA